MDAICWHNEPSDDSDYDNAYDEIVTRFPGIKSGNSGYTLQICEDMEQAALFPELSYPCAFQTWYDGGICKSATHYSNEFYEDGESHYEAFVERHENSGTFATLHVCETKEEYDAKIVELFGNEEDEE